MSDNFIAHNVDVLQVLNGYLPRDEYLFLSGVCSTWKECYIGSKEKETGYSRAIESVSRMKDCLVMYPGTHQDIHTTLCEASCMTRNKESLVWLCNSEIVTEFGSDGPSLEAAAYGGSEILNIVLGSFSHDTDCICARYEITTGAIRSGDRDMIEKWYRGLRDTWHGCVLDSAGAHGSIEILEWALDKGHINKNSALLVSAGKHSRLDVIEWCMRQGIQKGLFRMFRKAAVEGDLPVLKLVQSLMYLATTPIRYGTEITTGAASTGKINVLTWAHESGYLLGSEAYIAVASSCNHAPQDVVTQCLEFISRVIGTESITSILSTVESNAWYHGTTEETLEWLRLRA